ncbi:MAG: hypothetical protein AAF555_09665 [Verrucomicrobiota bacterium]
MTSHALVLSAALLLLLPSSPTARAQEPGDTQSLLLTSPENFFRNLQSGEGSLDGLGYLYPHFHVFGVYTEATTDISSLAVGDHDPQSDLTLQGIEPGISLRAGWLQGFANATGTTDADGHFSLNLEEAFLKLIDLPLGLELRGGQYLNRFGFHNTLHNHGWDYLNQNLVNSRFLNEGELTTLGGEISWNAPLPFFQTSLLSVSVGEIQSHDHAHGEEEHGEEAEFEGEGANLQDIAVTASWLNQYDLNDRHRLVGLVSGAWGDNEFGGTSQVYGIGLEYLWRENGYSPGGQALRWRNELLYRHFEAVSGHLHGDEEHEEEDHHDDHDDDHHEEEETRQADLDEIGLYSSLVYSLDDRIDLGLRGGWVSGISEAGLDDRFRLSPMITFYSDPARTFQARLQYNYDYSDDFGSEHSIGLQIGINLGGPEVR